MRFCRASLQSSSMSLRSFLFLFLVTVGVPQEDTGGIPVVDSNALPATEGACGWVALPTGDEIVQDGDGVEEYKTDSHEELLGDIMHGSCVPSSWMRMEQLSSDTFA